MLLVAIGIQLWIGIKSGLKPLRQLASHIQQRSAKSLDPISHQGIPIEICFLTDAINDLLQRLASALASQQRFIANAAHQLRTPLAGLKVQLELAKPTQNPVSIFSCPFE